MLHGVSFTATVYYNNCSRNLSIASMCTMSIFVGIVNCYASDDKPTTKNNHFRRKMYMQPRTT